MNTRFLFQGLTLDDRTEEYIRKRLERIEKLAESFSLCEVEVGRNKQGKFRVEIMLRSPHTLHRAEETTESVEGSTDLVVDQLVAQIVKNKDKKHDLKLRGGRSIKKKMVVDAAARF